VPIGSVVDIRFPRGGLRVHLDQAVEPAWDQEGHEPVLGVSVPVDRDTVVDRRYVHRIRLESEGTARRVRISTDAFAQDTEWFALDDCELTERGLPTTAVEQIATWKTRADIGRPPAQTARPAPALGAPRPVRHEQVARRFWIKRNCPRCGAVAGKNCVVNAHTGTGAVSKIPHYERIEPVLAERRAKAERRRRAPGAYDIACPDCGRPPGQLCASPSGGVHRARVERAREAGQ